MAANNAQSIYPFAPDAHLELLLQSFLCERPRGCEAFTQWSSMTDIDNIPHAHFRQMGELAHWIDEIASSYKHRARLLGMKKYVWSNNIHILQLCLPAVDSLAAENIPFMILKGGGIIASDRTMLNRRYIRDLDIMVRESDIPRASESLFRNGWRATTGRIPGRIRAQPFDKQITGNPHGQNRAEIDLHRAALHFGRYGRFDEKFWQRMVAGDLLGRKVQLPGATDRALIATMHGLVHDADGTFAWIVDAVRAFRHPDFDWRDFATEIRARKLAEHVNRVLAYLEATFGIGFGDREAAMIGKSGLGLLFGAELKAIARNRAGRGLSGKLTIAIAEFVRSHAFSHSVPYRTEFGIRMTKKPAKAASCDKPRFDWRVLSLSEKDRLSLEVDICDASRPHLDFDLWSGDVWIARLKIRRSFGRRAIKPGTWHAVVPLPAYASGDYRLTPALLGESG